MRAHLPLPPYGGHQSLSSSKFSVPSRLAHSLARLTPTRDQSKPPSFMTVPSPHFPSVWTQGSCERPASACRAVVTQLHATTQPALTPCPDPTASRAQLAPSLLWSHSFKRPPSWHPACQGASPSPAPPSLKTHHAAPTTAQPAQPSRLSHQLCKLVPPGLSHSVLPANNPPLEGHTAGWVHTLGLGHTEPTCASKRGGPAPQLCAPSCAHFAQPRSGVHPPPQVQRGTCRTAWQTASRRCSTRRPSCHHTPCCEP